LTLDSPSFFWYIIHSCSAGRPLGRDDLPEQPVRQSGVSEGEALPNSQPGAIHMYGGGVTAYLDKLARANWTNKLRMGYPTPKA